MKLELNQGAYEARGVIANAQRCINLIPEPNPKDAPFPITHYPGPGLSMVLDLTATVPGHVRGLYWASNGIVYGVIGTQVGILGGWMWTRLGDLPTNSGYPVSMVDNGLVLFIVDGTTGGWTVNLATQAFATINDAAFYGSARVDFIDTYFIFHKPNTPQFYISNSLSTTFNPLYFANKEGYNDNLVALGALHDSIWLLGATTTEVWYVSGAADFPFQRMPQSIIQQGCIAPYSAVVADNAIFWLSQDRHGRNMLMRGEGYAAKRVSNFAVEDAWSQYIGTADCVGMVQQEGGMILIVLQFITVGETWVYNATTSLWHQRVYSPGGVDQAWLPYCMAYWGGAQFPWPGMVVGSRIDAKIYFMQRNEHTDGGVPIKRLRSWPHVLNDQKRLSHNQFVAAMHGTNLAPDAVSLRWSDDGGQTWGTPVVQTTNNASNGQYSWRRLGMARDRVYEISWTSPGETGLSGAWLEATPAET